MALLPTITPKTLLLMKRILFVSVALLAIASCQKIDSLKSLNNEAVFSDGGIAPYALNTVTPKRFLFDAKKGETAGNADWVIDQDNNTPQRTPTPLQSTITATTAENYWTGGISAWGIALAKQGHTVETLPSNGSITYGSTTNQQDRSKYNVYVVDEPNIRFTTAEKTAIINFVRNGGGLFMISNHTGSDRNNDGWDSPAIWNDLMNTNSVQTNPFGFRVDLVNYSQTSTNVTTIANPITRGTQGTVSGIKFNSGGSATLTSGSAARGLIWRSGTTQGLTNLMAAYSTYGTGRVMLICDSSPADDGTGAPNNNLFFGWTDYNGNHSRLHMNASLWLAKLQ
jgi:hypothetical protein